MNLSFTQNYITYVRPLLEYNTVIWSPYKTGDISNIEKVQWGFTKRLPGLKNLTYKERLAATNLDTLELRRLRTDLIVCYKIVFGLIKVEFNNFFSFAPANNTRSHGYKLFVEQSTPNIRYHSFCRRVVIPWNNLPHNTFEFSSLSKFKHCLIRADLSKYLLYCID